MKNTGLKLTWIITVCISFFVSCTRDGEDNHIEVAVSSITISQNKAELLIGESLQLSASIVPQNTTYTKQLWATSKPSVASVSKDGLVIAISEGVATITVTVGDQTSSCEVTVLTNYVAVSSVTLNKAIVYLNKNEEESLYPTIVPENATNKFLFWTSSNPGVASVDQSGKVRAISAGESIISVDADGKVASCSVICSIPTESLVLDFSSINMLVGQEFQLSATILPDDASNKTITWTSADPEIASVSNKGIVTANSVGSTVIIAANGSISAKCTITVVSETNSNLEAVDLGLSVKWASVNLGATNISEGGNYYAWGETDTKKNFDWYSYLLCDGAGNRLLKYCGIAAYGADGYTDTLVTLEKEDDAAYKAYGGNWRIPTADEWRELMNNCTWIPSTINNKEGYQIVSNVPGYTENWIFLPNGRAVLGAISSEEDGLLGYYWTSSLSSPSPYYAWLLSFRSDRVLVGIIEREYGLHIRAVTE